MIKSINLSNSLLVTTKYIFTKMSIFRRIFLENNVSITLVFIKFNISAVRVVKGDVDKCLSVKMKKFLFK